MDDLRRRQIANWIPCSAFAAGVVLQSVRHGLHGTGAALLGMLVGASVFLIFYLLGGMGGGDVKLMAGFGALLGAKQLLRAALWTAGCGGLMALGVIAARAIARACRDHSGERAAGIGQPDPKSPAGPKAESIPYAPAIAAGVWLSLVAAP